MLSEAVSENPVFKLAVSENPVSELAVSESVVDVGQHLRPQHRSESRRQLKHSIV